VFCVTMLPKVVVEAVKDEVVDSKDDLVALDGTYTSEL
jgi:hypothetical protein